MPPSHFLFVNGKVIFYESSVGCIFMAASPFCKKTPPALLPKECKTKRPRQKNALLSGTNKAWPLIRGTTLISWV